MYLLLAFAYRLEHCDKPPRIPCSIKSNISASVNSSNSNFVYFNIALELNPGRV